MLSLSGRPFRGRLNRATHLQTPGRYTAAVFAPLLLTALLVQPDATFDARGDGRYTLPAGLLGSTGLTEANYDLRELRAENVGGQLRLTVNLGALANPWQAPQGFSGPVLDLFVKTRIGGQPALAESGFSAPSGDGWQYHIRTDGFRTRWWTVRDGQTTPTERREPLQVSVSGTGVVFQTPIPAGRYSYWVTSSVFSPFASDGELRPSTDTGPQVLSAPLVGLPTPVDVLAGGDQTRAYESKVLAPVGEVRDRRSLGLLALAGLGLLGALIGSLLAWRRVR